MGILKKQNLIMILSLILWISITLMRIMHHSPWYDEEHAWLIAQELNLFKIINLMKIEGHTFLWYLVLIPFAKSNFMYPYSMLILNWLFCFIAILILWLKSPFNNWVKFLISFSFPFLGLYPVVARCYAIGIMFLFAITAMDRDKLKHPNWYALLLVLCANTSVMAIVGATVFGLIFIYDLLKNKKKVLIPFTIMGLGAISVIYQLFGSTKDIIWDHKSMGFWFLSNVFFQNLKINIVILILVFAAIVIFYIKNKLLPIFLISTYSILFTIICIYSGNLWHWFFFYVYFLISSWLLFNRTDLKWKTLYISVLCMVSFFYIFYKPSEIVYNYVWQDKSKQLAEIIIKDFSQENVNIIITAFNYYSLIPFFKDKNFQVSNYCSGKLASYDTVSFTRSKYCYADNNTNVDLVYEQIDKVYDSSKKNIIIVVDENKPFRLQGKDGSFLFIPKLISDKNHICIYSIQKLN